MGLGVMTHAGALRRATLMLTAVVMVSGAAGLLPARAAEEVNIPGQSWSFEAPFGTFDRAQLQRGYKVYKEVCAACHGIRLLHFRNLGEPGGPGFSEGQVRALAAEAQVTDGPDDSGEMFERPGRPSDRLKSPYPNDEAARAANGGALPPDLSVMAKARGGGPDYIYALLIGYRDAPADMQLAEGMNYNAYFPGHQIAMPPPLSDGQVEYTDGSPVTVQQYARDVAAFLMWAAEPKLEERHELGFRIMIYLLVLAAFLFLAKRRVWSRLAH